jgi:DNA-binding MarR family transcriptional regulator
MRRFSRSLRSGNGQLAPAHFHMLHSLYFKNHNLSELAERLSIGKAAMSESIDLLESKGYVKKTHEGNDKRKVMIELTYEGKQIIESIHDEMLSTVNTYLKDTSEQERMMIKDGLTILQRTILDEHRR